MIELHRFLLTYILNSIWQVPLIALVALGCAALLRRTALSVRHRLWVTAIIASVLLPLASASGWFNALFGSASHFHRKNGSTITLIMDGENSVRSMSALHGSPWLALSVANALIIVWLGFVLYRAACLVWGWQRTRAIVRDAAAAVLPDEVNALWQRLQQRFQISATRILISDQIATPATVGARRSVVLLPPPLLSIASEAEFAAIFAHESAHIQRGDFLLNLFYEVLLVPVFYHPAIWILRSRLEDSRELVCDELAADQVDSAANYARSLIRIAESLSPGPCAPAHALGIFEGQNLERRIMTLLDRAPRLGRRTAAMVVIGCSLVFGTCCVAASAFNFQPAAVVSEELKPFAGTWHWMFKGKPFVTMVLVPAGDHFSGYMTNGFFDNDANGDMIDAGGEPGTSPILRTFFKGKVLHIVVQDQRDKSLSEWTMTLGGPNNAEFFTADPDVPKNLKPWPAERVSEEPPAPGKEINSDAVYHIGEGVSAPKLVSSAPPIFPPGHAEKNYSGICVVSLVVDASGFPERVNIVKSLGPDFDRSAMDAVKQYRFEPAIFKGQPVPVSVKLQIDFRSN
jgi:TonB family protein